MLSGNANQIRKSIKSGLRNNVRIISPTDFIQTLLHFPVHDGMPFSNALGTVKKDFHDGKRWRDFQKPGRSEYALETKFKESFVNIARAVSRVCQKYAPKDAIDSDWVDCQPNPPGRRRKDGYDLKIRPSIVQVRALTSLAFRQLGKDMWVAKEDEEQVRSLRYPIRPIQWPTTEIVKRLVDADPHDRRRQAGGTKERSRIGRHNSSALRSYSSSFPRAVGQTLCHSFASL